MTTDVSTTVRSGAQDVADALRTRLQRYIEAAYYLRNASVVEERRALLSKHGTIAQRPYLETTPSYETGKSYTDLKLPDPVGSILGELATWQPGIGIFPQPYRHQTEALQAFFIDQNDLIVSTGTGSGKTETFLLPILGHMLQEAQSRPTSYTMPGIRALLLYPMNALVSDQISRLRRLFGDMRLSTLLKSRYGRFPRFGMYTSRTPYPGPRNSNRDRQHLDQLLRYYLEREEAARNEGAHSQAASLVRELQERGRWPAKDLAAFFGTPGSRWDHRLLTQPYDRELLTRHEMQKTCPDILVTNYSMLEYTLMRPIERSIYDQTRAWLSSDPRNSLILVLDEAHLYRGTAGAEVAYLIRRLQSRLGISRDRMRCILTSASLGSAETAALDMLAFAEELTGSPQMGNRSFKLVQGYPEPRPPARPGNEREAAALADFDQQAFAHHGDSPAVAAQAVTSLAKALEWPAYAAEAVGENLTHELRRYLYQHLHGFGPIELLIAETISHATALTDLAGKLFPTSTTEQAHRATEALLALGTYAHNGQRPLLQTRVHLLFRGLPSLWACVNPHCTVRLGSSTKPTLLGRLYTAPRTHCTCGARVYEVLVHRDCGAVFLRVFGEGDTPTFYWHELGGRVDQSMPTLQEDWLTPETPHQSSLQKNAKTRVEPIWLDMMTGRVERDQPAQPDQYRQLWRSLPANSKEDADDESPSDPKAISFPFAACPICTRSSPQKVLDLATRGERPFANLVHEQFTAQPPNRPFSEHLPNGGRKVLIFADGRQKAARLARDLPREVEFDTFRQALSLAITRLVELGRAPTISDSLYAAFVAVCHDLRLHFFDREFDSQPQLLRDMHEFNRYYDADLAQVLAEQDNPINNPPMLYHRHVLDLLANPFYSAYKLGAIVVRPSDSALRRIKKELETLPDAIVAHLKVITTFWVQILLDRCAVDKNIPELVRERVSEYARPPKYGSRFRDFERVLQTAVTLNDAQFKRLHEVCYEVLTEQDSQGLAFLKPSHLMLELAFDHTWQQCVDCDNFQHEPLLGRCANCGSQKLVPAPPDDLTVSARYDYFRNPLRAVRDGLRPAHISAEEHTAQLSHRDIGAVYATTEEFELRFQDITLGDDRPPVDVLSCTTTMEVGIDIGSLVAIGMRNVPPQRENYQQRAGRAGRRGSAISTVVTFADNGPHDHFYYQQPEDMIAGVPRRPVLSIGRQILVKRHINAFLLQTFFHSQLDRLPTSVQKQLEQERRNLFTALGSQMEFFIDSGPLTFAAFQAWIAPHVTSPTGPITAEIVDWLPDELFPGSDATIRAEFVRQTAQELIADLQRMATAHTQQSQLADVSSTPADNTAHTSTLLDGLFDAGILPSYAFPTNLASFYVHGLDQQGKVVIKEQPQQSKIQALSEYAPGRLLVVNKETYRVGGIFVPGAGYDRPARRLFAEPLGTYVFCPICTYVRLEEVHGSESCPICHTALEQCEMLDPPGFTPEKGRPLAESDRDQEISYATGAQLPLPVAPDDLEWQHGPEMNMKYAYATNRLFVAMNRGPGEQGFIVCESCGAAWPANEAPTDKSHARPYLTPSGHGRSACRGPLHSSAIYLGTTFRSDLLLLRTELHHPLHYDPAAPWLHDALRTTAEALALAASRSLDIDPVELSAGYRLLPPEIDALPGTLVSVDLYLFDTAAGGAGYAAEAGAELGTILDTALKLVENCPQSCERSCTRCLRHYGNRFWHNRLDRHLAAHFLRYLMTGQIPAVAPIEEQRRHLAPLRRFLELEGWNVEDRAGFPLAVRSNSHTLAIGTFPALLDHDAVEVDATPQLPTVFLRDYVLARDLPAAYHEVRRML